MVPRGPGPWAKVKGGSLDGRFLKLSPPDATVIRCYFSREHLQWSEAYTLLADKVEIDDEDPDLV